MAAILPEARLLRARHGKSAPRYAAARKKYSLNILHSSEKSDKS
jgi:hypothetical protein